MKRLVIAGSRNLKNAKEELLKKGVLLSRYDIIVSGGSGKVDNAAIDYAKEKGKHYVIFKPLWDVYGKAAGPIRNSQMAEYSDTLLLIWDGKSRGSANMLKAALKNKLKINEVIVDE